MTAHRDSFIAYRSLESPKRVWLGDKSRVYADGIAQIALDIASGQTTSRLIAQDILHVPILHNSLLSVSNLVHYGYALVFDGTGCKIRSTASGKLIPGTHIEDSLPILNAIPSAHHARIRATYSGLGGDTLAAEIENAPDAANAAYTTSNGSSILPHQQPAPILRMAKTGVVHGMKPTDVKGLHALHSHSRANKQHRDPKMKESDLSDNRVIHAIHELRNVAFHSDGSAIRSTASGIPIAYVCVEDHLYILNAEPSIHHARIRTKCPHLDEPDEEPHQLDPKPIECALFDPPSSRLDYRCAGNLTDRFYELRDDKSDDDYASTPELIRLETDLHIFGVSETSLPSFTPSVEAFHMPKEPPKAASEDTPSEDNRPSDPGHRNTNTEDNTHMSSSEAAQSLASSRRSTRLRKTPIFGDHARLKMIFHCRRSEPHPHAPPSDSVGDTYAYKYANIASLDLDLLRPSYSRRIGIPSR
jgi:hypothetical protein